MRIKASVDYEAREKKRERKISIFRDPIHIEKESKTADESHACRSTDLNIHSGVPFVCYAALVSIFHFSSY
jgi:hypothetical protein